MLLAAAASNKVSEARPKKLYVHLAEHSKSQRNDELHNKCIVFLRRFPSRVYCCMCKVCSFVQRFCNSIGHNIMSHTATDSFACVFASRRSAFRFAYQLESVSAPHSSRPSNTRCGPQLSTSILPSKLCNARTFN